MKARYIINIIVLALLQALFFNNVRIMGVATPMIYVYFVLQLPRHFHKWQKLLLCFLLGTLVDMFSNTHGLAMTALTAVGFMQSYFLELFLGREDGPDFKPSIKTMGFWKFSFYAFCLILTYCTIFFMLDAFSLADWQYLAMTIGGSLLVTLLFILFIDAI